MMSCKLFNTKGFGRHYFVSLTDTGITLLAKLGGKNIIIPTNDILGIALLQSAYGDNDFARTKRNLAGATIGGVLMSTNSLLGLGAMLLVSGTDVKQQLWHYVGVLLKDGRFLTLKA
ncbi:MAG: hypothetical protein Q4D05_05830, partial [Acinetobacter sp.]|nr:hypothetical protein [Acinetobacter sp.]